MNSLLMQFFMFYSFLIDGFAHASEALTGKFIGAGDRDALKKSIRLLFAWGTGISVLFTLIYLLAGKVIFGVLTNNPEVIANAKPYFFWVVMVPLISYAAFLWDGIYIGATAGREMRNAMLISTLVVFFPVYILAGKYMGNHGLWLAFMLFMLARSLSMQVLSKKAVFSKFAS